MVDLPPLSEAITEGLDSSVRRLREPSRSVRAESIAVNIASAIVAGGLSLFVGAGVSYGSGFPSWTGLLKGLADQLVGADQRAAFDLLTRRAAPLVTARFLQLQTGVRALFPSRVHEALYCPTVDYGASNPALDFVVALGAVAD